MRIRTRLASLALLGLVLALPVRAQDSHTERLFIQFSLDSQSLYFDEDDFDQTDEGGGLSLRAGWGVSPLVTLYLGVTGARVEGETNGVIDDAYDWGAGEIGARFNFRAGQRWVPYADVALRGVAATEEDIDLEFTGGGLTLGGGLTYFVSPSVAFDLGLRFGGGGFDEVQWGRLSTEIDADDFSYGEGRVSLGMTFFPLR